jgi:hypothetical protein
MTGTGFIGSFWKNRQFPQGLKPAPLLALDGAAREAAEKLVACHPEVASVPRDRRICFIFNTRKQQILRYAQDDTSENSFSAACKAAFLQRNTYATSPRHLEAAR